MDKLSNRIAEPINDGIEKLEENPQLQDYPKIQERKGYSIRVGNYLVIYEIFVEHLQIEIITLGYRKDIYNKIWFGDKTRERRIKFLIFLQNYWLWP